MKQLDLKTKKLIDKLNLSLCSMIIAIMLISCIETLQPIPDNLIPDKKSSVVMGEIVLDESEFSSNGNQSTSAFIAGIKMANCSTSREYEIIFNKNEDKKNYFYILLPSGRYIINEIKFGGIKGHPRIFFDINGNGNVYYVGSIKIERIGMPTGQNIGNCLPGNIKGERYLPMKYSITDNFEADLKLFNEKYPDIKSEIIKSMVYFGN